MQVLFLLLRILQKVIWYLLYVIIYILCSYSTFLDPETRRSMGEQAVALAKSVQYESAGSF